MPGRQLGACAEQHRRLAKGGDRTEARWNDYCGGKVAKFCFVAEVLRNGFSVGSYEIRRVPHGGIESGRITKVKAAPVDDRDIRVSMLARFPIRYVVATISNGRPVKKQVWLLGLNDWREVTEEAETNDR
ncbi:MAG: hypothetical protein JWM68_4553 [Verrucomicrobiales bacterium]|nr:hypothetical protein [Verrucomicrobiales bacterium]